MLNRDLKKIKSSARKVIKKINPEILLKNNLEIVDTQVETGSGSLPTEKVPSVAISIQSDKIKPDLLSKKLRSCQVPVLNYISKKNAK